MPNPPAGSPTSLGRLEPSNRCELACSTSPTTQPALQMVKPCCCCTVSPYEIHSYVDVIPLLADAASR